MPQTTTWNMACKNRISSTSRWPNGIEKDSQMTAYSSNLSAYVTPLLMAVAAFTTPLAYKDPVREFPRSGVSVMYSEALRRRKKISLLQARQLALVVLAESERRREIEREEERRLLDVTWSNGEENI
jgi:hypothetical protein